MTRRFCITSDLNGTRRGQGRRHHQYTSKGPERREKQNGDSCGQSESVVGVWKNAIQKSVTRQKGLRSTQKINIRHGKLDDRIDEYSQDSPRQVIERGGQEQKEARKTNGPFLQEGPHLF